jgi:cerevisin
MSDVVKGIEYVAKAHKARIASEATIAKKHKRKSKRVLSAANMSLGGGKSRALDMAVNAVVAAGVHFAVAAGNDDRDACGYSPAASTAAITVGASTVEDSRAWFSNWGRCVDIFGPGFFID